MQIVVLIAGGLYILPGGPNGQACSWRKGEKKWPCAIKMKPEKVLALSLVFSFFFPSVKLQPLHHSF